MSTGGFHTIQVAFDETCATCPHQMFMKEHAKRDDSALTAAKRTLFVVNVPPYCKKDGLRNIFSACGSLESIHLMTQPMNLVAEENASSIVLPPQEANTFQVAYLVFKHPNSLQKALDMSSTDVRYMNTAELPVLTGVDKWAAEHAAQYSADLDAMEREADDFMRAFDQKDEAEKQALKEAGEADDEGWVTVASAKRPLGGVQKPAKISRKKKKQLRADRQEKELMNFYMFQQREQKRDKVAELRRKFEEDKRKIARMKQDRRFKPF